MPRRRFVPVAVIVTIGALLLITSGLVVRAPGAAADEGPASEPPSTSAVPDEELPGLGKIIGSPDAGPDPQDAGDRGGWAQLTLAAVLLVGVGFIGVRIGRGLRTPNGT